VAVGVKIISSLALNKILAVFVGPSGYALMGQLQNAITMLLALVSGTVSTGVTKYTAEYIEDDRKQHLVWQTAVFVGLSGSLIIGLIVAIFHRSLALFVLKSDSYANIFLLFAVALPLFVINTFLLSVLNGKKEIKRFVVANISGSFLSLLITGIFAFYWGLYGALISLAINQSVIFFVTLWVCIKTNWFSITHFLGRVDIPSLRGLLHYTVMSIATTVLGPFAYILVRNLLAGRFSLEAAGHWEALMRISGVYLMFITTPLSVYYLPRLAELHDKHDIRKEMLNGYKIFLPLTAIGAFIIFLFRDWIITILFTKDFAPMRSLFAWQMAGDVFKIASWLLSFFLLSKAMTKSFLFTEIFFTATYVLFVWLATAKFYEQGAQIAYCVNYAFYFLFVGCYILKILRSDVGIGNTKNT